MPCFRMKSKKFPYKNQSDKNKIYLLNCHMQKANRTSLNIIIKKTCLIQAGEAL